MLHELFLVTHFPQFQRKKDKNEVDFRHEQKIICQSKHFHMTLKGPI